MSKSKNHNKRAQAAVETLLIYGVTILIVMLAIGALIGFGVIDLGRLLPDNCEISSALVCENYEVSATGNQVQLELRNTLGKNIQGFTVDIEGEGNDLGIWGCDPAIYGAIDADGDGNVDGEQPILVNGDVTPTPVILSNCNIQVPKGKKIQGVISVEVYPVGSNIKRPVSGKIRATVN
ncbi:MAG: hypothetical protein NDI94_07035 [Candidatus Woesearchaeota archaeon]|nr:hypothetical protein [Candidatus Woesearchaeota archaeon]